MATTNLIEEARNLRKQWQELLPANDNTKIINAEALCDEWLAGTMEKPTHYVQNMPYRYNGQVYKCNQTHDNHGEVGYEPDKSQALFSIAHTKDKTNPKPYVQPTGSHDAYMRDECCLFELDGVMKLCTSKANNNVYSPKDYAQYWLIEDWTK